MVDFSTASFNEIAHSLIEDGIIDDEEIAALKARILDDEAIDQEEAEFLFEVNDLVSGKENSSEFEAFFIEAITAFLLSDSMSPGYLDGYEWDWLQAMISEDDGLDNLEARLLEHIAEEATSVPDDFAKFADQFQEFEYENEMGKSTFFHARIMGALKNKVREASAE